MADTLADMFEGVEELDSMEFVQVESEISSGGCPSPRRCNMHCSAILLEAEVRWQSLLVAIRVRAEYYV